MSVAVLVPRRSDGGRRDRVWDWVKDRWTTEHPDYVVLEGDHVDGPFNRAAAINTAAANAPSDTDVFIVADADSFAGSDQITAAVAGARTGPGFWLAYDTYRYLTKAMSDAVMGGFRGDWLTGVEFSMTGTCSSMVVCTRALFTEVGGMDEGFVGWGFEDVALSHALQTFGGGIARTPGSVWHLWHPSSPENSHHSPVWQANRERMLRYGDCAYDRPAMRSLLVELGVGA